MWSNIERSVDKLADAINSYTSMKNEEIQMRKKELEFKIHSQIL